MNGTKQILFITLIAVFLISACSAQAPQITPVSAVTQIVEPGFTPSGPPLTEADVPRVSIEEARAALEAGTAVIVDVRPAGAFESKHIAGAISVPLEDIERNPAGLELEKEQWIITYCT
ncbi:MAG: rhodanese-like domain-containing protein [Anaerolineales bacterium]